jgi:hypothetical protein
VTYEFSGISLEKNPSSQGVTTNAPKVKKGSKMQSVTVRPASLPTTSDSNPFLDVAHETASGVGKLLKFSKGQYLVKDSEVAIGTELIAHVDQIARAWVKFQNNKMEDIKLFKVADRTLVPARSELGDLDQDSWEIDPRTGHPQDCWTLQWYLPLSGIEDGELLTFVTSSRGGIGALGRLCSQYGQRVKSGKTGSPLIKLMVSSYRHKQFGLVHTPEFKISQWEEGVSILPPEHVETASGPNDDMDDSIPF